MVMRTPVIIVNFKSYRQVDGLSALALSRIGEDVAKETGTEIAVCPPMIELGRVADRVSIPVLAQNVDLLGDEVVTGGTTLSAVKAAGAHGILVNHSECRRRLADIESLVSSARALGLETVVCTNNVATSKAAAAIGPNFIAMEPPELIGGDISVTSADPGIVKDTVLEVAKLAPEVKVLTGAGVKNGLDAAKALELGTYGILIASGVVKAKDQKAALLDLASAMAR